MMFCSKCRRASYNEGGICSYCGTLLEVIEDFVEETEEKQEAVDASKTSQIESKPKAKATPKQIVVRCILWAVVLVLVGIGIIWCSMRLIEQNKQREEMRRKKIIESTLIELGNRSSGSVDVNTVEYSMALSFISDAALGKSNRSSLLEASSEEVKDDSFEHLESYFESDYVKTYAALLFGADYFDKEEVEHFYNGTKVNAYQMKEDTEDIMFRNHISLASLLIDKEDEIICMNISLRIKMAEDGYISTEGIISDLYDFTYGGVGIKTVADEKLQEEITYEELPSDVDEVFEGKKVYYDELSPVGKMVFLYNMPRYVVQFDQEAGSELWDYYFNGTYESVWNSIINRDMFKQVVEF